jgi:hypothetical protein
MRRKRIMVKGRYVGQITVDFCFDENAFGMKPYEEMHKDVLENFNEALKISIADAVVGDTGTVEVEQQYLDLYLCEGGKNDGEAD